jgi:endoribonuclease Dicer
VSNYVKVDKVALVYQQYSVLDCNLDQPIASFTGDSVEDKWSSKDFWDEQFSSNMIVVCTAAILQQCLHRSYIQMDQINLLIFDEAHHAKKDHPYARIIKDFYAHAPSKPRIFGMTASPVDAQTDLEAAAKELEILLQSEIATIDPAILGKSIGAAKKEHVVRYATAKSPAKTALTEILFGLVGRHEQFRSRFAYSEHALVELGPWCVDRFWKLVFKHERIGKLEAKTFQQYDRYRGVSSGIDTLVAAVREAGEITERYAFENLSAAGMADKVHQLLKNLKSFYNRASGETTRCIVFVEQRYTAMMLSDLFQQDYVKSTVPQLRADNLVCI